MFEGYCRIPGGGWTPPVHLENAEEAVRYAMLQKKLFAEVRIVDEEDFIVIHVVNHEIVFPPQFAEAGAKVPGDLTTPANS